MSRSTKRDIYAAHRADCEEHGGRVSIIRKTNDKDVAHSGDCYLCIKGTAPKRMFQTVPRRRAEQRALRAEIEAERD